MDHRHLTRHQADKLRADIARQLAFLNKLCARVEELGWPEDDLLGREAVRARDAILTLLAAAQAAGRDAGAVGLTVSCRHPA